MQQVREAIRVTKTVADRCGSTSIMVAAIIGVCGWFAWSRATRNFAKFASRSTIRPIIPFIQATLGAAA